MVQQVKETIQENNDGQAIQQEDITMENLTIAVLKILEGKVMAPKMRKALVELGREAPLKLLNYILKKSVKTGKLWSYAQFVK